MSLFEQIKAIPKVDMHINLTSSISTNLAFDLNNDSSIVDVIEKMQEKNYFDYENSLKLPIKILRSSKNISLAINDLIDRLIKNNVIYGELFLDLPLYNKKIDEEKVLLTILDVIKEREYHLEVVMVLSSEKTKEENLYTLSLFEKYYNNGVNGIYFNKDKMANLSDYMYLFDRLIKNNYPYILPISSKVLNSEMDIYNHGKRIIYALNYLDDNFLLEIRKNNILLEFSPSKFLERNIISDIKDYFIYDYLKENGLFTITTCDMTTLNTDIINEWCLLFNNYPLVIHDLIKVINNSIVNANIINSQKEKLISKLIEESDKIL